MFLAYLNTAGGKQSDLSMKANREIFGATHMSIHVNSEMNERVKLKAIVQQGLRSFIDPKRCEPGCPAFDLCRKCVFIVGGIARMETLYRQLIENSGGVFEYHNGHMKGGTKQLENSLKRADIVLCPVNCNSHAACFLIKKLGKKHDKPTHMMANFSLSAISQKCGHQI
uniref:DUF2325 domain-containing protein n=2 Tax=Desulfobacterium TaxID=2295 RepID=E1Y8F8_9BACT|nr:hypothetical protein N47_A08810 [uncultured Desulfobacterium sp.]